MRRLRRCEFYNASEIRVYDHRHCFLCTRIRGSGHPFHDQETKEGSRPYLHATAVYVCAYPREFVCNFVCLFKDLFTLYSYTVSTDCNDKTILC